MTVPAVAHSYDDIPYPGETYVLSHPTHLATIGMLMGMQPTPVERCRVLELGCANGSNLIPMADDLPGSTFVGIDLSARQIAEGHTHATALGLHNITLQHMNILDVDADFGEFDYIIAHGIYSWAPQDVRDKILTICKQNLTPNGIAYVSYNTYPGWHVLIALRNLLLYNVRFLSDPHERARKAFDLIDFLASTDTDGKPVFASTIAAAAVGLRDRMAKMGPYSEAFMLHDILEAVNEPISFHEFAHHAIDRGLQYLAEADFPNVFPHEFAPEAIAQLQRLSHDVLEMEQYLDYLRNETFRRTLLCHHETTIRRALSPAALENMFVLSHTKPVAKQVDLRAGQPVRFRAANDTSIALDHQVSKAAMLALAAAWPRALTLAETLDAAYTRLGSAPADAETRTRDAQQLAANLLKAFCYSASLVRLLAHAPVLTPTVSEQPIARPLARLQAREGGMVTNVHHNTLLLDEIGTYLLPLLDGTHDRVALVDALASVAADGAIDIHVGDQAATPEQARAILAEEVEQRLQLLALNALLVG